MTRGSLRTRLLVALVGVTAVAVAASTVAIRQATRVEVRQYFEDELAESGYDEIDEHLDLQGSFDGIEPVLQRVAAREDQRLVLATDDGEVLADSAPGEPRPSLDTLFGDAAYEDLDSGETTVLYVLDELTETESQADLLAGVDRRIAVVAVVTLALAVAVAVGLSRRLVRPLDDLRASAMALGAGDVAVRARSGGPGEVGALATAFNDMARQLEASEQARLRMTADAAHELRTPLANLRAYVEGMVDGVATPDGDDLAVLHEEVVRLSSLVDDLQQLALADAGQLRLDREPVEVAALLAHVAGAVQPRARAQELTVTVTESADDAVVHADAGRLLQVVTNLVDNAIAHAPAGSTIRLASAVDGAEVTLQVADEGPGIPEAEADQVFERLRRVDPARSRNDGGAGLGLAIARSLVEAHGGTIRVAATSDAGTTIEVRLPLADQP